MAGIELRIRNLKNGEAGIASFDDEKAAEIWLRARPRFVVILGEVDKLDPALLGRLRDAMRPFDAEEKAVDEQSQADMLAAARARAESDRKRFEQDKVAAKDLDPDRPMEIRWTFDGGMALTDATDSRPIPDEARAAVLAWVAERDEWVSGRGQMVGDATVSVYPNKILKGDERVINGRFVPVTREERTKN
jgi:hypothetical protein